MTKEQLKNEILKKPLPTHIALILDGNGRWAKKRLMPRTFGHQKGAKTLREIIIVAKELGIKYITTYAFSTENWSRPKDEVDYIMNEAKRLCAKFQSLVEKDIRFKMIGSRKELDPQLLEIIELMEEKTKDCKSMTFLLAFNYGSKEEIIQATKNIATLVQNNELKVEDINNQVFEKNLYTKDIPPVDLLIRTSGEVRISNYLLWQIAYAEMIFTKVYWPDFHAKEFYQSIYQYQSRNRRFGGLENK